MHAYEPVNYIAYAIPFFIISIFIELIVVRILKRKDYRLNDSVNDLTMGIYQQLIGIFLKTVLVLGYIYIYEHFRLFSPGLESIPLWVGTFLAVDFFYYWFHRASHEVAVIWGSHEPHHQSEEYNLTVALRQGAFQSVFSTPFYWPLALVGIHPIMYLVCSQFNTIYQFWIHTRLVGKLGPIEWIFNTPSHHRVHHGINPKYIDRNHGGVLIIWDRLFGTFQVEEEEPVYGTVKPLASWNPAWANVQYWWHLLKLSLRSPGFLNKILVWIKPPGWKPAELGGREAIPEVSTASFRKFHPAISDNLSRYVLTNFAVLMAPTMQIIFLGSAALSFFGIYLMAVVLISLLSLGFLLEGRRFSLLVEALRLFFAGPVLTGVFLFNGQPGWACALPLTLATVFLGWLVATETREPVIN